MKARSSEWFILGITIGAMIFCGLLLPLILPDTQGAIRGWAYLAIMLLLGVPIAVLSVSRSHVRPVPTYLRAASIMGWVVFVVSTQALGMESIHSLLWLATALLVNGMIVIRYLKGRDAQSKNFLNATSPLVLLTIAAVAMLHEVLFFSHLPTGAKAFLGSLTLVSLVAALPFNFKAGVLAQANEAS